MFEITLRAAAVPKDRMAAVLAENAIRTNTHAAAFLAHPELSPALGPEPLTVVIASLRELGFPNGATLEELLRQIPEQGRRLCPAVTGFYLRLAWREQRPSTNTVLSGQHRSPEGAVVVLSAPPERSDAFPKGLYLRNVGGELWLRGYICDFLYRYTADDFFAVAK